MKEENLKVISFEEAMEVDINSLYVKTSRGNIYGVDDYFDEEEVLVSTGWTTTMYVGGGSSIRRKLKTKNVIFMVIGK